MMEPVDRTKGMSIRALACFTWRHLCRFSLRSFLALLAMAGFLAASCWLWNSVQSGEREAERLYLSTVVGFCGYDIREWRRVYRKPDSTGDPGYRIREELYSDCRV